MLTLLDQADALSTMNAAQDAAVANDVGNALGPHADRPDLAHTAHVLLPQIIDLHAHRSSLLTAQWYDGIDPASSFHAQPFDDVPPEQIDKVIDWALHAPGEQPPVERLIGSSQRLVRGASRQTVTRNADKEGVLWARYAKPTACAFCRALSMRGSGREDRKHLYASDKAAEFRKSDGDKYHTLCECEPIAIRGGQVWTPPDYTAEWTNQYTAATKDTPGGDKYFARVVEKMRSNEAAAKKAQKPDPVALKAATQVVQDNAHDDLIQKLSTATDVAKIEDIARELFPDMEYLSLQSPTGVKTDSELAQGAVRALADVAEQYPLAVPNNLHVAPEPVEGVFASTFRMMEGSTVRLNSRWMTDYRGYDEAVTKCVKAGFHYPGTGNPAYDTMVHELAHVMQDAAQANGVLIEDRDVRFALMDFYIKNYPDPDEAGYTKWLRDNLSGYSIMEGNRGTGGIPTPDTDEAIAEAFADVFINGDDAHTTSKVLTLLLTDAVQGKDTTTDAAEAA